MGWATSLYIKKADDSRPDNASDQSRSPGSYDLGQACRVAKGAKGVLRVASPELLAVCLGDRRAINSMSLPFIEPEEIAKHNNPLDGIWIVIDDKVYDCTDFVDIHPGGSIFFEQFAGKQCTWQFWRFHGRKHLSDWSPALLIGRTWPIPPNPYKEPPRWIKIT